MEVSQSVADVVNLQYLLSQSDVMELFDALSEADVSNEGESTLEQQDRVSDCENNTLHYLCGSIRKEPNYLIKKIVERNCQEDGYKQGTV